MTIIMAILLMLISSNLERNWYPQQYGQDYFIENDQYGYGHLIENDQYEKSINNQVLIFNGHAMPNDSNLE